MRLTILALATIILLASCAGVQETSLGSPKTRAVSENERIDFVQSVARAQTRLDGQVDGMRWHGLYGGTTVHGCARVRLSLVGNPKHDWHYLACGREVFEIMDVAPKPVHDPQIAVLLDGLSRGALRTDRVQRMPYGGYELEAEAAGPTSSGGCRIVEQRLIYQDMVIDVREERLCRI